MYIYKIIYHRKETVVHNQIDNSWNGISCLEQRNTPHSYTHHDSSNTEHFSFLIKLYLQTAVYPQMHSAMYNLAR